MQPNERARYAYQYYLSKGISPEVAAGIVANFAIESGNFDDAVISGQRRGDQGSAYYTQQLRGQRKDNYHAFAQERGVDPSDFNAQLDFFLEELNPESNYVDAQAAKNRDKIFGAPDPMAATSAVMQHYERASSDPKLNHLDRRQSYAKALYADGGAEPSQLAMSSDSPPPLSLPQPTAQSLPGDRQPIMYPERGPSPGDGLIAAGQIMMGKSPSNFSYKSAFAPAGGDADAGVQVASLGLPAVTSTSGYAPSDIPSGPGEAQPIGLGGSLVESGQTEFGPKPVHDGVNIEGMLPTARDALTLAATHLGRDIPLTSAHRSQAKQDQIRGRGDPNRITVAKNSRHTAGDAVDISIKGMSDEEVAELTDALAAAGFTAFGYYGQDGHIHADMRSSVPNSFNPDTGWGGWTTLPPHMMERLVSRGYRAGLDGTKIRRGFGEALL